MRKIFLIVCLSLFVSSCSTTGSVALKEVSLIDIVSSLTVGITTREQIIKVMGAPNSVGINKDSLEVMTYEYKRTVPRFWNFTPVILLTAGSETEVKQLVVLLNQDKTVKETITNVSLLENRFGIFE